MIPNLKKPRRIKDPSRLAWVRTQPCCITAARANVISADRRYNIEANHIREEGHGGIGTKPSDWRTVPMLGWIHDVYHEMGRRKFEEIYKVDLEGIIKEINAQYLRENPRPKRERKSKVRTYQKRIINRGWAVISPEFRFPVVATMDEARLIQGVRGGKIVRCQIRIEGELYTLLPE